MARYGRAADGSEALIVEGHDTPPRIVVRGPDGRVRVDRNLIDVAPWRTLVAAGADSSGPPSFTADGRYVYFTTLDQRRYLRAEPADAARGRHRSARVVARDIYGGGGFDQPRREGPMPSRAPTAIATTWRCWTWRRGPTRCCAASRRAAFVSLPRFAARRAAAGGDGVRRRRLLDPDLRRAQPARCWPRSPTGAAAVHDASWADATHVVYLAPRRRDDGFQVYLADLASGQSRQLTHAPYLAFEPQLAGGDLRFLNREGWRWTLDEQTVSLAPIPRAAPRRRRRQPPFARSAAARIAPAPPAPRAGLAGLAAAARRQPGRDPERRPLPADRPPVRRCSPTDRFRDRRPQRRRSRG